MRRRAQRVVHPYAKKEAPQTFYRLCEWCKRLKQTQFMRAGVSFVNFLGFYCCEEHYMLAFEKFLHSQFDKNGDTEICTDRAAERTGDTESTCAFEMPHKASDARPT